MWHQNKLTGCEINDSRSDWLKDLPAGKGRLDDWKIGWL